MNKHDYLGLDGYTLRTFITVLEEASVSKAALRLGVSQSAVSHTLDRLRLAFDDALFVRDGRGIIPTAKAVSLREPIESIISNIKSLTEQKEFDPLVDPLEFTIATNDFPMLLIFPRLIKKLQSEGINPRFHFMPAGVPSANLARASRCQLLITPAPPKAKDIIQEPLFQSKMVCFYDAKVRQPPKSWKQFVNSNYAEVKFSNTESSIMVLPSIDTSVLKTPTITVPNFSALNEFIKGSNLITTQLELMKQGPLKGLDSAPLPIKTQAISVYLAWHQRDHNDPAQQWLRQRIIETVDMIITERE
ncbi:MAG: LysR family transcriptional regulator [Gammaproteobacteria bacterium]